MLSNVHFTGEKDLEFRSGGDVDHSTLVALFKLLGYKVHVLLDQTAQVQEAGNAAVYIRGPGNTGARNVCSYICCSPSGDVSY